MFAISERSKRSEIRNLWLKQLLKNFFTGKLELGSPLIFKANTASVKVSKRETHTRSEVNLGKAKRKLNILPNILERMLQGAKLL